jgi:hypothetical protein
MRLAGLLVVMVLAGSGAVAAQEAPLPEPGARVRVTTAAGDAAQTRVVGTLLELTAEHIVVRPRRNSDAEVLLPRDTVARLEVSERGRRRWLRGLGFGALGGAVAGGVLGVSLDADGNDLNPAHALMIGAAFGMVGGAVIGTVAGATTNTERWHEVPLTRTHGVQIGPDGTGVRVAVRVGY